MPRAPRPAAVHSATLAINETIGRLRAEGRDVLHLGFGEAGLPVLPSVAAVLADAAGRNGYGPVAGSDEVRDALAGWFSRRGVETTRDQVIVAPGSKALLYGLLHVLDGDLVLPTPSWVSYAAQAGLMGKRVVRVPVGRSGGIPDPDTFGADLERAKAEGADPGILVVTVPDNPTGTVATDDELARVCAVAAEHDLVVISDEIYADVTHDGVPAPSAVRHLPDATFVTTGLSKSLALGGWRIGAARVPDTELGRRTMRDLVGAASEIWSALPAPMQAAAAHVWSGPQDVLDRIDASRRLHGAVARAVHEVWTGAGAQCRAPQAGFYLYPDLGPARDVLAAKGIRTAEEMTTRLLEEHGIAVLPGSAFGDDPARLTARVATSLLYGDTEGERLQALRADDPISLPWVRDHLDRLRTGLDGFLR